MDEELRIRLRMAATLVGVTLPSLGIVYQLPGRQQAGMGSTHIEEDTVDIEANLEANIQVVEVSTTCRDLVDQSESELRAVPSAILAGKKGTGKRTVLRESQRRQAMQAIMNHGSLPFWQRSR